MLTLTTRNRSVDMIVKGETKMKFLKSVIAILMAVVLVTSIPVFPSLGFTSVAEAGVVSKAVKVLTVQMFGRVLLRQGGKMLRQELLGMIKRDPKILDHLAAKGLKWVKKNPKIRKEYDEFIAEAKSYAKFDKRIEISRSRYPESAKHIDDAVDAGHPRALEIDRAGAAARRRESLAGTPTKNHVDRDEYPPAMTREGGKGASVRYMGKPDNRGSGSCVRWQCIDLPNGARILFDTVD